MDGLLFDTEPLYYQVGTNVLARRGKQFADALRRDMMGRPGPDAIQLMIRTNELTDRWQDLLAEAEAEFLKLAVADLRHMPGLESLLSALDANHIPYGVATSSRRDIARELLTQAGLISRLQFVLSGDDIVQGKPHPEIYLSAANKLHLAPEQMLVLEDSGNGCRAGIASGACVIAVPSDQSHDHCFDGVHAVAKSLADPVIYSVLGL